MGLVGIFFDNYLCYFYCYCCFCFCWYFLGFFSFCFSIFVFFVLFGPFCVYFVFWALIYLFGSIKNTIIIIILLLGVKMGLVFFCNIYVTLVFLFLFFVVFGRIKNTIEFGIIVVALLV